MLTASCSKSEYVYRLYATIHAWNYYCIAQNFDRGILILLMVSADSLKLFIKLFKQYYSAYRCRCMVKDADAWWKMQMHGERCRCMVKDADAWWKMQMHGERPWPSVNFFHQVIGMEESIWILHYIVYVLSPYTSETLFVTYVYYWTIHIWLVGWSISLKMNSINYYV